MLAGGCFWGMQGVFEHVKGVTQVLSGYSGGACDDRALRSWSAPARPGHAETVKIVRSETGDLRPDPARLFLRGARSDGAEPPGPRQGTQYRSDIFYTDADAEADRGAPISRSSTRRMRSSADRRRGSIAFTAFYPAEDYHQDYLIHNPDSALHRRQRSAEDRESQAVLLRPLPRTPC